MRVEDLFKDTSDDPFSVRDTALDQDLLKEIGRGTISEFTDIEIAEAVCTLARNELVACANGPNHTLSDSEFRQLVRAGLEVSRRLGIDFPELPFRDFTSFQNWWKAENMTGSGSWQLRREWVHEAFKPFDLQITELLHTLPDASLVDPVPTTPDPDWNTIEKEITLLRHRYTQAQRADELCAVGLVCVRITEMLGDIVLDPSKHVPAGQPVPGRGSTINRFDMVIAHELPGSDNADLRKMLRGVVAITQSLKHRTSPTKREAALACDSTIALVNMMRNIVDAQLQ